MTARFGREPRAAFLREVANVLGSKSAPGTMAGVNSIVAEVAGRAIEIGCSAEYWFETDIFFPGMPETVWLKHAPVGYYARAKFTEDGYEPPVTGDPRFDDTYLIIGDAAAEEFASYLAPELRELFVRNSDLAPSLSGGDPRQPSYPTKRLRARPSMHRTRPGFVLIGTQNYKPARCADLARKFAQFAQSLQSLVGPPPN